MNFLRSPRFLIYKENMDEEKAFKLFLNQIEATFFSEKVPILDPKTLKAGVLNKLR